MRTTEIERYSRGWVEALFASIDAMDAESWLGFLKDDATFTYGSQPALHGKHAVRAAVGGLFAGLNALQHSIQDVWHNGDTVICRGEVRYEPVQGGPVTLPFVNVLEMQGERIRDYRVYIDPGPLAQASTGAHEP